MFYSRHKEKQKLTFLITFSFAWGQSKTIFFSYFYLAKIICIASDTYDKLGPFDLFYLDVTLKLIFTDV